MFCTGCGTNIQLNSRFCSRCGKPAPVPSSGGTAVQPSRVQAPPQSAPMSSKAVLVILMCVALLIVMLGYWAHQEAELTRQVDARAEAAAQAAIAEREAAAARAQQDNSKRQAAFDEMTAEQHFQLAKRLLTPDALPSALEEGHRNLDAIPPNSPQAAKGAVLVNQLNAEEKRRDAEAAKQRAIAAKEYDASQAIFRDQMAKTIESKMLDEGYDMEVKATGTGKTTLYIKYILVGKVFVHQFEKQDEIFRMARGAGFKKIVVTDGYDASWYWNL